MFFHSREGRPRCEMWPVFSIFVATNQFLYAIIGFWPVYRPLMGRFFIWLCFWPFLGHFRDLYGPGGTTYHPRRKSVLNRRNAKNNLFWPGNEKI